MPVAKWVFCPDAGRPIRVDNDKAAEIVALGGGYLGKYEAARMLAALDAKEGADDETTTHNLSSGRGHRTS